MQEQLYIQLYFNVYKIVYKANHHQIKFESYLISAINVFETGAMTNVNKAFSEAFTDMMRCDV